MSISRPQLSTAHQLTVSAPAKINLQLEVLGLRADGFHELAMVMQSIDLADRLVLTNTADAQIKLSCDQPSLTTGADNLIVAAAKLLRQRSGFSDLGASIALQKRIPIGAGLAGGSSDGAAALVGLNALWNLGFTAKQLETIAAELGSDMPFCVAGGTQLCFGRGELLEALPGFEQPMAVILLKDPSVSVSTPWAYGRYRQLHQTRYLKEEGFESRRQALRDATWLHPLRPAVPPPLRNDLQKLVAPETQAVEKALALLNDLPSALAVAMSGSGPSCFALFRDQDTANAVLEKNRQNFAAAGLNSWCCNFRSTGVMLEG